MRIRSTSYLFLGIALMAMSSQAKAEACKSAAEPILMDNLAAISSKIIGTSAKVQEVKAYQDEAALDH